VEFLAYKSLNFTIWHIKPTYQIYNLSINQYDMVLHTRNAKRELWNIYKIETDIWVISISNVSRLFSLTVTINKINQDRSFFWFLEKSVDYIISAKFYLKILLFQIFQLKTITNDGDFISLDIYIHHTTQGI